MAPRKRGGKGNKKSQDGAGGTQDMSKYVPDSPDAQVQTMDTDIELSAHSGHVSQLPAIEGAMSAQSTQPIVDLAASASNAMVVRVEDTMQGRAVDRAWGITANLINRNAVGSVPEIHPDTAAGYKNLIKSLGFVEWKRYVAEAPSEHAPFLQAVRSRFTYEYYNELGGHKWWGDKNSKTDEFAGLLTTAELDDMLDWKDVIGKKMKTTSGKRLIWGDEEEQMLDEDASNPFRRFVEKQKDRSWVDDMEDAINSKKQQNVAAAFAASAPARTLVPAAAPAPAAAAPAPAAAAPAPAAAEDRQMVVASQTLSQLSQDLAARRGNRKGSSSVPKIDPPPAKKAQANKVAEKKRFKPRAATQENRPKYDDGFGDDTDDDDVFEEEKAPAAQSQHPLALPPAEEMAEADRAFREMDDLMLAAVAKKWDEHTKLQNQHDERINQIRLRLFNVTDQLAQAQAVNTYDGRERCEMLEAEQQYCNAQLEAMEADFQKQRTAIDEHCEDCLAEIRELYKNEYEKATQAEDSCDADLREPGDDPLGAPAGGRLALPPVPIAGGGRDPALNLQIKPKITRSEWRKGHSNIRQLNEERLSRLSDVNWRIDPALKAANEQIVNAQFRHYSKAELQRLQGNAEKLMLQKAYNMEEVNFDYLERINQAREQIGLSRRGYNETYGELDPRHGNAYGRIDVAQRRELLTDYREESQVLRDQVEPMEVDEQTPPPPPLRPPPRAAARQIGSAPAFVPPPSAIHEATQNTFSQMLVDEIPEVVGRGSGGGSSGSGGGSSGGGSTAIVARNAMQEQELQREVAARQFAVNRALHYQQEARAAAAALAAAETAQRESEERVRALTAIANRDATRQRHFEEACTELNRMQSQLNAAEAAAEAARHREAGAHAEIVRLIGASHAPPAAALPPLPPPAPLPVHVPVAPVLGIPIPIPPAGVAAAVPVGGAAPAVGGAVPAPAGPAVGGAAPHPPAAAHGGDPLGLAPLSKDSPDVTQLGVGVPITTYPVLHLYPSRFYFRSIDYADISEHYLGGMPDKLSEKGKEVYSAHTPTEYLVANMKILQIFRTALGVKDLIFQDLRNPFGIFQEHLELSQLVKAYNVYTTTCKPQYFANGEGIGGGAAPAAPYVPQLNAAGVPIQDPPAMQYLGGKASHMGADTLGELEPSKAVRKPFNGFTEAQKLATVSADKILSKFQAPQATGTLKRQDIKFVPQMIIPPKPALSLSNPVGGSQRTQEVAKLKDIMSMRSVGQPHPAAFRDPLSTMFK